MNTPRFDITLDDSNTNTSTNNTINTNTSTNNTINTNTSTNITINTNTSTNNTINTNTSTNFDYDLKIERRLDILGLYGDKKDYKFMIEQDAEDLIRNKKEMKKLKIRKTFV